jgi:hypothetical protein
MCCQNIICVEGKIIYFSEATILWISENRYFMNSQIFTKRFKLAFKNEFLV